MLFIFSLFCEYIHLEYARIYVIYRVDQSEYLIHIVVVAPEEYVNLYSTRRQGVRISIQHVGRGCVRNLFRTVPWGKYAGQTP